MSSTSGLARSGQKLRRPVSRHGTRLSGRSRYIDPVAALLARMFPGRAEADIADGKPGERACALASHTQKARVREKEPSSTLGLFSMPASARPAAGSAFQAWAGLSNLRRPHEKRDFRLECAQRKRGGNACHDKAACNKWRCFQITISAAPCPLQGAVQACGSELQSHRAPGAPMRIACAPRRPRLALWPFPLTPHKSV